MTRSSGLAASGEGFTCAAGRYRVEALIGRGGMGAVYAAVDTTTGKRIALKRTPASTSAKTLELFRREFHTLHGLRHPNIIEVYDYGSDAEGAFYTMELLEGSDLGHAAPLAWRSVCRYLLQVSTLLGLLHARRLLHRDLTPRNLWVLPDGRLKLIDFGALSPFGVPTEIVGTPPFIAPEWMQDRKSLTAVDQRADIYMLGALAYWLLTGKHAYPARSLNELPHAWERAPAAPSKLVAGLAESGLEPIPVELDTLVLALLRLDPDSRPETIELVIDRIGAIAGQIVDPPDHAVRGYIRSKAFVGRRKELALIGSYLGKRNTDGRAFAIEATAGMGRSRLLEELSVIARLAGAACVLVRASDSERAYGVANQIALRLLDELPAQAAAAAHPYSKVLAQLSPDLQNRLQVAEPAARDPTARGREQLQHALTEWVFALARERRLLLLVDDLHASDEESGSWLTALALQCGPRRLLLTAALIEDPSHDPPLHITMFRSAARRLPLAPLSAAEVYELLRSVFGKVTYIERVAESLFGASHGNPAHCIELIEHLVERGLARYVEGSWTLPGQLAAAELPRGRAEMHLARLDHIGDSARRLAEVLSVHDGRLTQADCVAASESDPVETAQALVDLTLCGVLVESGQGYVFAHASVREHLEQALQPERRLRAHARLSQSLLLGAADPIDAMRAGLHAFRAGDRRQCEQLVRAAARHLFEGHRTRMHAAVAPLEQAVELYRAAGLGPDSLATPLACLAAASFFVDRRLSDKYGYAAMDTLEQLLHFDLARNMRPYVGAKLSLAAALAAAGVARRKRGAHAASVTDLLRMLLGCVVALNAVAASALDQDMCQRCKHALEPLAGLGDQNIAGLIRRATLAVASIISEQHAATFAELTALRALLESDAPIRDFPDHLRVEFLGGCLFSLGIMQCWRQDPAALTLADQIEPLSPMYALNADQLRAVYYSGCGDRARAELHRQRVEARSLQVGAAWQVVTLGPTNAHLTALWTHDALLAKRAAAELRRLSQEIPRLRAEALRARATYLVLSGRYHEAIEALQTETSPRGVAGWMRMRGVLARAYNRLSQHARAREICLEALAGCSEQDLDFLAMNLHVQLELALAQAALGDGARAGARIDLLLVRYAAAGLPARGALHETRARIALIERDFATCHEHCEAMLHCYGATELPSLRELGERLILELARAEQRDLPEHDRSTSQEPPTMERLRQALGDTNDSFEERAGRVLQLAAELTGAERAFVMFRGDTTVIIALDDRTPDDELVHWAEARIESCQRDETAVVIPGETQSELGVVALGEWRHCAVPLDSNDDDTPVSLALVLGFSGSEPRAPRPEALAMFAEYLTGESGEP